MEYLLDTGWACGWVKTGPRNIIVDTAPIFKKLVGKNIYLLPVKYNFVRLQDK